jgi:hypothetical protein
MMWKTPDTIIANLNDTVLHGDTPAVWGSIWDIFNQILTMLPEPTRTEVEDALVNHYGDDNTEA